MSGQTLTEQLASQDWIEWTGLITGLFYVGLAAYEKPSCWMFGIISCAAIAWKSFTDYKLMADGILQLFYIGVGVVGLMSWIGFGNNSTPRRIYRAAWRFHGIWILICLVSAIPAAHVLIRYAGARYGYPDTALMLLSVFATILLVRKELNNWIYWIIIDVIYVYLYLKSDGFLFCLLFAIYTLVAAWGYRQWKRHLHLQPDAPAT